MQFRCVQEGSPRARGAISEFRLANYGTPHISPSKLNSRQYLRKSIWNSLCVLHCFLPVELTRRCEWQLQRGLEPCPSQTVTDVSRVKRQSSVRESFPINQSQLCFTRCGLQRNQSCPFSVPPCSWRKLCYLMVSALGNLRFLKKYYSKGTPLHASPAPFLQLRPRIYVNSVYFSSFVNVPIPSRSAVPQSFEFESSIWSIYP